MMAGSTVSQTAEARIGPLSHPQEWDTFSVAGIDAPGIIPINGIRGFRRKSGWDIKTAKGSQGSVISYTNRLPSEGSILLQFWTDNQISELWPAFIPLFLYDPTKKDINALDISHPALAQLGITSVVCKNIGPMQHKGGQLYEIEIEFIEYIPPPPAAAVSTPKTSAPDSGTAEGPSIALAPIPVQIVALMAELAQAAVPRAGQSP